MSKIDGEREFLPLNIAIITVSDTRTFENDKSGDTLAGRIEGAGHKVYERLILKDEAKDIAAQLKTWADNPDIDVVITTGGTGVTGRDVTPEAFRMVIEKEIPGFGEVFRWVSYQKIKTSTIQSRAMAGLLNATYMFALPGSSGAVKDAWDDILVHQLDARTHPCNFVELMPRLNEHLK
jgi:molybdenum cofactor biosynthesis protein B